MRKLIRFHCARHGMYCPLRSHHVMDDMVVDGAGRRQSSIGRVGGKGKADERRILRFAICKPAKLQT